MVKTPRTRHQKREREPVTIDLDAIEVKAADTAEPVVGGDAVHGATETLGAAPEAAEVETANPLNDVEEFGTRPEAREASAEPEKAPQPKEDRSMAPPAAAPPRRGSGIASGLVGAALAIAGVMGLQYAGLLSTPGGTAPAGEPVSLAPVQAELDTVKQELAALKAAPATPAPAADPALAASVEAMKADLAALQKAVQSGSGGDAAAVAALNSKLQELEARSTGPSTEIAEKITGIQDQITTATDAISKGDGCIAALEQSVAGLTGQVEQQASQPKVALAIAAAALKSAMDRGGPFNAELETLAAIAPQAAELEPLRPLAKDGVATEKDLADSFGAAANAMVAADAPPVDPNAGIMDRLLDLASSLVKVRKEGDVEGEDADARVARMEVAIKAGNYQDALTEYDALPVPVQAAGAAYVAQLKARMEAARLVDQLVANAMKAA